VGGTAAGVLGAGLEDGDPRELQDFDDMAQEGGLLADGLDQRHVPVRADQRQGDAGQPGAAADVDQA